MLNVYKKTNTTPFISRVMLDVKKMKAELNQHRYCLERNVERRTEHLLKRVAVLEYCNATLCDKLALAQEESAALKQHLARTLPKKDAGLKDRGVKLYVLNSQAEKLIGSNVQEKWDGQATAA